MDVQLKELIDKIKIDGVKSAEENAAKIIADAEARAAGIVETAKKEAQTIRERAKADADRAERSGKEALRQAGRDLLLTLRGEIETLFNKVVRSEASAVLDESRMAEAVAAAINILAEDEPGQLEVLIPSETWDSIERGLRSKLSAELSAGTEIKPFREISAGFRISMKDGSAFYDFSDAEIASMLGRYLNPRLAELLSE